MGRRSGGSGLRSSGGGSWLPWSKSRSSSSLVAKKPTKKDPPKIGNSFSSLCTESTCRRGLGSSFADGMSFGGGNAAGHRVADAVLSPRVVRHEVAVAC
ncbi:hypothetical protein RND71_027810 [Anisodus tanguticus]|uniref:Uncharacterized protein n=1 Tax=Anisodus tanguticus TaxID=243964 RepID=A0AAE1RKB7_9SOLA|nr:hypothetical protein RND71_027810 [Anisodus tanguticus]